MTIAVALLVHLVLASLNPTITGKRMKIRALAGLMRENNHLIDTGKYDDISIRDIHTAIERKSVLKFLAERAGTDIDVSAFRSPSAHGDFEKDYEQALNDIYSGYAGNERRKWGVERLGLCLLLAWTTQIIQHIAPPELAREREESRGAIHPRHFE